MTDEPQAMSVERVRVINGHTSPETAYTVDDYPYGYSLRCKIRYWTETAEKGTGKGQQRFVSQTTNPKKVGEVWNKPKASTYSPIVVMYLDHQSHVHSWGEGFHLSPVVDARARLMGIIDQLTEQDRKRYDALLKISHGYAQQWHEWEEQVAAIIRHIEATGSDPVLVNGVWVDGNRRYYLGDHLAIYTTTARQRLEQS